MDKHTQDNLLLACKMSLMAFREIQELWDGTCDSYDSIIRVCENAIKKAERGN